MRRTRHNIIGLLAYTVFMTMFIAMMMVAYNSVVPAWQ